MDSGIILQTIGKIQAEHGAQLGERLRKGCGLWYSGQCVFLGGNEWRVFAQSNGADNYTVRFNLKWTCTCPDCQHGAPEIEFLGGVQKTCKHILACGISWLVDSPEACERPHPQPSLTIPRWVIDPDHGRINTRPTPEYLRLVAQSQARRAAHQDAADMGHDHQARDQSPPVWFGQGDDIENELG